MEGERLRVLIRDSSMQPPARIEWDLGPVKGRTRLEIQAIPEHIKPFARHLGALEPRTGELHWQCLRCGTLRHNTYRAGLVREHHSCGGAPTGVTLPRLTAQARVR
eukprot:6132312-Amphidinium_carterae.1